MINEFQHRKQGHNLLNQKLLKKVLLRRYKILSFCTYKRHQRALTDEMSVF